MPHSRQRHLARARARATNETLPEAAAGLQRVHGFGHGLDHCDDAQRQFRCLLALGLFNAGPMGASPGDWGVDIVTCYTLTVSPRHALLKLVTDTPANVAGRLLPTKYDLQGGLPGLRLVAYDRRSCLLRHQPTDARLLITQRRDDHFPVDFAPHGCLHAGDATADSPLSRYEQMAWESVPQISPDAAVLLSGLVSRLNVTDPKQRWATGTWHNNPLQRAENSASSGPNRCLWGAGDHWDLRWQGRPLPSDVAGALTDGRIGVAGLEISDHGRAGYLVRNGSADLTFGHLR